MAPQLNEPFLIEKKETFLVKPSQPTPSHLLSLSTIDNTRDLEFLCHTIHVYCSNGDDHNLDNLTKSNDFCSHFNPSSVIQEALCEALVYYYPLAGRLKRHEDGKLRVDCTGEGVPFLAANANCTLASLCYFNGVDTEFANQFVIDVKAVDSACPLVIQVTQFTCGGFTVGMGLSHSVCDGFGSGQFVQAVAELANGKSEPSLKPVWERHRLEVAANEDSILYPIDQAPFATSPHYPTLDIVHKIFNVDSECIRKLKMGLMQESDSSGLNESFTTLEILGAYVWRSKFSSMEMNLDGVSNFSLTMGIRDLLDPPLPKGYYGNAFVPSLLTLSGKDLCEAPLSRVVKLIKESKKNGAKAEFIRFWLGFLEKSNKENAEVEGSGSNMIITDWRHLGLFEMGIGGHHLVEIIPLPGRFFANVDVCIFMPPFIMDPSMKRGVRVLVTLPRAAMAKFKQEMDSLKVLEESKV